MDEASLSVGFEEEGHRGRFVLLAGGAVAGEMTFSRAGEHLVIVDHTEVDASQKGRNGGRRLFEAMVAWARETGTKVLSTCPFASAMFARDPESRDVLAG